MAKKYFRIDYSLRVFGGDLHVNLQMNGRSPGSELVDSLDSALRPVETLARMGAGAMCAAAKNVTEAVVKKKLKPHQPLDLSYSKIMQAAGEGAFLNAAKNIGTNVAKKIVPKILSGFAPEKLASAIKNAAVNSFKGILRRVKAGASSGINQLGGNNTSYVVATIINSSNVKKSKRQYSHCLNVENNKRHPKRVKI